MDVDHVFMDADEKEKLMKSGTCFNCKKQGHLSRECPNRKWSTIREAKVEKTNHKGKEKENVNKKSTEEPPSYDSLLKQINACSMEDRQKILEIFSNDGGSDDGDF